MAVRKPDDPAPTPLDERSRYLRRLVIQAIEGGGRGHVGPAMSPIEILRVLYDDVLRHDPNNPEWPGRDRFILSKGHGCLALYAVLADKGYFPVSELSRFCHTHSFLGGHPERGKIPGVEASTGALGHGLPIGVGMALAARIKRTDTKVFVLTGDGETNEGSVWEAAMAASKHRLSNLTVMVDYNKIQSYGPVPEVMPLEPFADKWRAFGFEVVETDGHDSASLRKILGSAPLSDSKPGAVICHTVKGKGLSAAEHNPVWHHKSYLRPEDIQALYDDLESR
jgi:transketolase